MKEKYKIVLTNGKYHKYYKAECFKRITILWWSFWYSQYISEGKHWSVQDDINEWVDELRLPSDCIQDLTVEEV